MLDTIEISNAYLKRLTSSELTALSAVRLPNRLIETWVINTVKCQACRLVITVYFPPSGLMYVATRVSIPKLVLGHNSCLINQDEAFRALSMLCESVSIATGLNFNLTEARIKQIDFSRDIVVPENEVLPIIKNLAERRICRMKRNFVEGSTLYFYTGRRSKEIRIYSKYHEVLNRTHVYSELDAARGKIRVEAVTRNSAITTVARRHASGDRSAHGLVNQRVSDEVIDLVLTQLQFPLRFCGPKPDPLDTLVHNFKATEAARLFGFYSIAKQYGRHFFRQERFTMSRTTYQR